MHACTRTSGPNDTQPKLILVSRVCRSAVVGMISAYSRQWRADCGRSADGPGVARRAGLVLVPREAVDDATAAEGKQARRPDGKLPPHVIVYFVMALALFATMTMRRSRPGRPRRWQRGAAGMTCGVCRPQTGSPRLGSGWAEPVNELFSKVAVPVVEEETAGAFLGNSRLMAIDGFDWEIYGYLLTRYACRP